MKTATAIVTLTITCAALGGTASNNTAYRCTVNGRVSYSDSPCVGAKVVDTTPTDGLGTMTGKPTNSIEKMRRDMWKEIDKAMKPMTGMTPEQSATLRRRSKLQPEIRDRCYILDNSLESTTNEVDLYKARKEYYELKC